MGGVRASSDVTTLRAVGSASDFEIVETVRSETTAESYFARGRYDRSFGVGFGFAGAGWERTTFSGIQNRYQVVGGLGIIGPVRRGRLPHGAHLPAAVHLHHIGRDNGLSRAPHQAPGPQ